MIDDAAGWAARITAAAPGAHILTTSRTPLRTAGEHTYLLDPLPASSTAAGPGAAVRLFTARARAARSGAVLPPDAVARICRRLDGLPLAIELAAARVRSLSVTDIEHRLADRFALLTTGERTAPERHRTLLAAIDWSWNLLDDDSRLLLRRLCRFPDGFDARTAQAVGGFQG